MNIFTHFEQIIGDALTRLQNAGVLPPDAGLSRVSVEPPREAAHGDIATNAALVLAKPAKMPPRALAEKLVAELEGVDDIEKADIAGPGFINLTLAAKFWPELIGAILSEGADFGRTDIGQGRKVNVEFVSANPTGPMHVGHCRGAVFGDALANLLEAAGWDVTREYYINDAGAQVDTLARSAYLRYREALGEKIGAIPEGLYPGDYLVPVGDKLAREHGEALLEQDEDAWLPVVRETAIDAMMDMIRADLAALNIHHDVFFSERSLKDGPADEVADTIVEMEGRGLVYEGVLPPPKGRKPDDWEEREQTLFRATQFGDDVDRPLRKSDGSHTYFAADMAYHRDKFERGFNEMIDVWGADHGGYIKRMQAAVKALTDGNGELDVKICQLVRLFRGGEPVKMSKRSGEFVTLREVVDEVGRDPVRFMMLYRRNDAPLDFDFAKVTEQSRDNPVFYVQYAHARCHSVFRMVREAFADFDANVMTLGGVDLTRLNDDAELALIKRMSHYPRILESAAEAHEPHRIAFYLYELASDFHALWTRGKESPQLRFINERDRDLTMARLALVKAVSTVLAAGLGIAGVEAVREMR